MAAEHTIARYRQWYRKLLHLYSRPHRERFAESMEQTFNDLCRERADAGQRLGSFVLWMFVETSAGIFRENAMSTMMKTSVVRIAIVVGLILLVPLLGNLFIEGWDWPPFAFAFWGILLFGAGLAFELIASKGGTAYRVATGIAVVTAILLFWVNAAVGIIGEEDLANAMYLGVLVVGFIGACLARFEPHGMSRALVATAIAQALVPLIALTWVPTTNFAPGVLPVLGLNAVFVALWLASALLFRYAAGPLAQGPLHSS